MRAGLDLSAEQEDALREVANIMIGHAATALARLSGMRIDIEIPMIEVVERDRAVELAGGGSGRALVAGVRTRMLGRLKGEVYVTFPRESALGLTDALRGLPLGHTKYMTGAAAGTLIEVGNIVAGACLAAFYKLLDVSIVHSVPEFVFDMPEVLLSGASSTKGDHVLAAQVRFHAPAMDLNGHLVLLFTVESMAQVVAALENAS